MNSTEMSSEQDINIDEMPPIAPRLSIFTSHIKPSRPALPQSRASSRGRTANSTMAPVEVKEYEYIVVGGGSGGSGTARYVKLCIRSEYILGAELPWLLCSSIV